MDTENKSKPAPTGIQQATRNEHGQFLPGVSGNPKGRVKGVPNWSTVIMEEALRTYGVTKDGTRVDKMRAIAQKLLELALAGDMRAISEFGDRAEGKPRQSIDLNDKRDLSQFEFSDHVDAIASQYDDQPPRQVPALDKPITSNRRPGGKVRIRLANVPKQKKS